MRNLILLAAMTVCMVGKAQQQTFCNPMNIPYRYALVENNATSYREAADPTIIVFKGEYYLFASKCGVYYHSTDLVHWDSIHTTDLPMEGYAPPLSRWTARYTSPTRLEHHACGKPQTRRAVVGSL